MLNYENDTKFSSSYLEKKLMKLLFTHRAMANQQQQDVQL